ncbi:hypothetical protein FGO68_gene769 [Halteria grandinella]|uniref:Uncharacterized protein n=1 Tax=Halteria grandinella TaxID=5974 RepID=A0A8J8NS39_HALGN|nr:hypothetical protein FGO68_gene769 [Halteria grandinella]
MRATKAEYSIEVQKRELKKVLQEGLMKSCNLMTEDREQVKQNLSCQSQSQYSKNSSPFRSLSILTLSLRKSSPKKVASPTKAPENYANKIFFNQFTKTSHPIQAPKMQQTKKSSPLLSVFKVREHQKSISPKRRQPLRLRLEAIEEVPAQENEQVIITENELDMNKTDKNLEVPEFADNFNQTRDVIRFNSERDATKSWGLTLHKMEQLEQLESKQAQKEAIFPNSPDQTQVIIQVQEEQDIQVDYQYYQSSLRKCKDLFGAILLTSSKLEASPKSSPWRRPLGLGRSGQLNSDRQSPDQSVTKSRYSYSSPEIDKSSQSYKKERVKRLVASPECGPNSSILEPSLLIIE